MSDIRAVVTLAGCETKLQTTVREERFYSKGHRAGEIILVQFTQVWTRRRNKHGGTSPQRHELQTQLDHNNFGVSKGVYFQSWLD